MPSAIRKMKEQNVKILDPFLKDFVKSNFAEMMSEDYDVDTMVYDLGITDDDNITDDEKEMLDDIVKSMRKEFMAKLQKKLFMSIKRYDMLTEVICKDKRKEKAETNERDQRIMNERQAVQAVQSNPLAKKISDNIVEDPGSNICITYLEYYLCGWKDDIVKQQDLNVACWNGENINNPDHITDYDRVKQHGAINIKLVEVLKLLNIKDKYDFEYRPYTIDGKEYTTLCIKGVRWNDMDLSF